MGGGAVLKSPTGRFLLRLFFISVVVNYVWEMAQMPLYENMPFSELSSWLICLRASLGDGLIIVAIWATGYLFYRSLDWFRPLTAGNVAILAIVGAVIAAAIEFHALATGRWVYSSLMPMVPLLGIGVSPFVQLLVLPWPLMLLAKR